MKIIENVKGFVSKKVEAVKDWTKKHPTATKVIAVVGGTAATSAVVIGGLVATGVVGSKKDEDESYEITTVTPEMIENSIKEEIGEDRFNAIQEKYKEEERLRWNDRQDDWQKVIDVGEEIKESLKGNSCDGYYIYKSDDDSLQVAYVEDGDYYYPPETTETVEAPEPTVETSEEA